MKVPRRLFLRLESFMPSLYKFFRLRCQAALPRCFGKLLALDFTSKESSDNFTDVSVTWCLKPLNYCCYSSCDPQS